MKVIRFTETSAKLLREYFDYERRGWEANHWRLSDYLSGMAQEELMEVPVFLTKQSAALSPWNISESLLAPGLCCSEFKGEYSSGSPLVCNIRNAPDSSNVTCGYDAKGNLTTVSGTSTFTYDAFNRMSSAGTTTYYVDPEGQRLRKTVSGVSTYFAPDAKGPLMAESQGGGWSDYVWLGGRLIARVNGGQILAVHDDQVGRPEVMTDQGRQSCGEPRTLRLIGK